MNLQMNRRTLLRAIVQGALGQAALAAVARATEPVNPVPPLQLHAEIRDGRLAIDYAVENSTSTDLYLETGATDLWSIVITSPGIEFVAKDALAMVYRLPNIRSPLAAPLAALRTLVRAGSQFSERLELTLPLREDPRPASCRHKPNTYRSLRFNIDYIWSLPGMRIERLRIPDDAPVARTLGNVDQPIFPLGRKLPSGTLTSDIFPLAIPVIECAET